MGWRSRLPGLLRVDRAEAALRTVLAAAGVTVRDLRVRDLGDVARIEVDHALVGAVGCRPRSPPSATLASRPSKSTRWDSAPAR